MMNNNGAGVEEFSQGGEKWFFISLVCPIHEEDDENEF
jgi:hypothetical protein